MTSQVGDVPHALMRKRCQSSQVHCQETNLRPTEWYKKTSPSAYKNCCQKLFSNMAQLESAKKEAPLPHTCLHACWIVAEISALGSHGPQANNNKMHLSMAPKGETLPAVDFFLSGHCQTSLLLFIHGPWQLALLEGSAGNTQPWAGSHFCGPSCAF